MRNSIKTLVLTTMMAITGAAIAADTAAPPAPAPTTPAPGTETPKKAHKKQISGKVESTTATTIVITNKKSGEITITVDASTKYTLDKEPSELSKITAGMYVATTEGSPVTEVHAFTKQPEHKPKPPEAPAAPAPATPAPAAPAAK
jgi:hypothetical protein